MTPEIALLACGRDAALVWDRAEAGLPLDTPGRDCPHCSAAYADARLLDATVHRMAAEPVPVPPSALEAVLGRIDPWVPSPDPVLLDDTLAPLGARGAAAVLEALVTRADRTQLVYLTDDGGLRAWAESLDPAVGRCVVLTRSRWRPRRLRRAGRTRS